jgi:hypothetical protein
MCRAAGSLILSFYQTFTILNSVLQQPSFGNTFIDVDLKLNSGVSQTLPVVLKLEVKSPFNVYLKN